MERERSYTCWTEIYVVTIVEKNLNTKGIDKMRIITQAIRIIDYEQGQVFAREIMLEFGEYIQQLISYIQTNTSVREYKTQSTNTEVIRTVVDIVKHQSDEETVGQGIDLIAGRLLRKESETQEQIGHMGVRVQKGSLILALVEKDGNTIFLLAKVEHTDFFDDTDYSIKTGFSKDEKKIWKTCLFEVDDVDAPHFLAKIYSNTAAKYWWHDFLELQELQSDEVNTKKAFQAVETVLSRNLKKTAPYDYTVIQNAVYAYFNSVEQFDYGEMIERMLENYTPNDMTPEKKEDLLQEFRELPEKRKFDCRFHSVPAIIKPKMRKTYDVYHNIQVKVLGEVEDLNDVIQSYEAEDGNRYLKIRVNNDATFRAFECKGQD